MRFAILSAVLLGLAAFASAVPNPHERRLAWISRSLGSKNKNINKEALTIVDTTIVELTEKSRNSEIELTVLIQEKIKKEGKKKTAKDNVRKNHYKNKNKNVNTVIIVVTEILDIRDPNNHNKRYMQHQVRADNKAQEEVIVQVTEVVAITISNAKSAQKATKTEAGNSIAATAASGAVAQAIQTVDPNAPFAASNQTIIMPSGAAAPQGKNVDNDPAAIVEEVAVNLIVVPVGS